MLQKVTNTEIFLGPHNLDGHCFLITAHILKMLFLRGPPCLLSLALNGIESGHKDEKQLPWHSLSAKAKSRPEMLKQTGWLLKVRGHRFPKLFNTSVYLTRKRCRNWRHEKVK
jgi:hypothetical protein